MKEDYGNDFVTIIDDEGNEFELELLDTIEQINTTLYGMKGDGGVGV